MDLMKLVPAILGIMLIAGGGYFYGHKAATEKYLPQLVVMQTKVDVADAHTRSTIEKQKENENAVANEIKDSVARINARYERLLSEARNKAGTSPAAGGTQTVDGTSEEQRAINFERACALDASSLTAWQDWAIKNQIPVGE